MRTRRSSATRRPARLRPGRRPRAARLLACVVLAGCAPTAGGSAGGTSSDPLPLEGTPEGLPGHAPTRFAFGNEATEGRIALWDIDIRPDGAGLPAGSGTVAEGEAVYNLHCLACHGPTGTEGPNDRLVGREPWEDSPTTQTVGNYWPYATTLYDFIAKAMPQLTPGILTADQNYAVIAYILYLNEIVPADAVMNAQTLPAVVMPARDRFVIDDRQGGTGPIR